MNVPQPYSNAGGHEVLAQLAALARYKSLAPERIARIKARSFAWFREAIAANLGSSITGRRIVEIGSGQWMANAKCFATLGAEVLAVDPELPPDTLADYGRYARTLGLQRATKTLAGEILLRRRFEAALARETGLPVGRANFQRWSHGAERLPWEDGSADAVVSDNVFEHLPDVGAVVEEMARVLAPEGLACITIHPYTAFSGGHHPATIAHDGASDFSPSIPPWDHLRDERHPSGVFLNRVRLRDFRALLESRFETISWETGTEGERFLTPQIQALLPEYTRQELLTGKVFYIGRLRQPAWLRGCDDEGASR